MIPVCYETPHKFWLTAINNLKYYPVQFEHVQIHEREHYETILEYTLCILLVAVFCFIFVSVWIAASRCITLWHHSEKNPQKKWLISAENIDFSLNTIIIVGVSMCTGQARKMTIVEIANYSSSSFIGITDSIENRVYIVIMLSVEIQSNISIMQI